MASVSMVSENEDMPGAVCAGDEPWGSWEGPTHE